MNFRYIGSRLIQSLFTIIGATTVVFLILRFTPGDPAQIMLGDYATPQLVAQVRHQWGLDKPIAVQYFLYLQHLVTGNFGHSFVLQQDVGGLIASSVKYTFALAIAAMIVTCLIGIPLGLIAARKRNSVADYISMLVALVGICTPDFALALVIIYVFSYELGWFPVQGTGNSGDFPGEFHHLILPAFALGIRSAALVARTTRSAMLEVLGEDHVRTARAKGLAEPVVVRAHVWRNALIPIITILGIYFGQILGGATVIEIVFGRPGLGKLLIGSILARDYPLSQGLIIVFLVGVVIVNLITDLLYGFVDPRLRSS
jgi:ABC-type dipeptide/oligopeptide/nickel transport system permease component